ncbi:MAG: Rieske 2Fe-2S domain-containing protein [Dehalococcoidales bacterium]|nr:Rieske 2Fe-2S domain-containing protein [Dehalococcoidales bacterium]
MGNYVKVASKQEIKDGGKKKVTVNGKEIMVANVDGSYYAIDNRCPHFGGDLSAGTLEGTVITCPRHGSQFDVRNGKNTRWLKGSGIVSFMAKTLKPPKGVTAYKTRVEGADILVEL